MAIDSSLIRDFYVILDSGRGEDQIHVTFLDNPLVCWIWRGGGADWPGRGRIVAFPFRERDFFSIASCTQNGNS